MIFLLTAVALTVLSQLVIIDARCMNWCSKNGICTEAGDAGYCICNRGFYGADCSKQYCPKAYDPLIVNETSHPRRSIILTVGLENDVPGKIGGDVVFEFNKDTVTFNPYSSGPQCSKFIEQLPGVGKANCIKEKMELPIVFNIEFTSFSVDTIESNVYTHEGNPSLGDFFCDTIKMVGYSDEDDFGNVDTYCTVADLNTDGLPEYAECSNHGECNSRTGKCSCERGFYGRVCDDMTDAQDHHLFEHDGPYFTGSVVKGVAYRKPSSEFNVLQLGVAESPGRDFSAYTTVRGDGNLIHSGGDIVLDHGKIIVHPLQPFSDALLDVSLTEVANAEMFNATALKSSTRFPGQYHIKLYNIEGHGDEGINSMDSYSVLNVSAQGDISTAGILRAANGTFVVENGVVVAETLNVENSLDVRGSANIEDSLTIGSGFALTPEGMTIDSTTLGGPLLELRAMQEDFEGSLLRINTVEGSASSLIQATVDDAISFEVTTKGDMLLRGLRMQSGGIDVESGGVRINAGGLRVKGGITLESGDLVLPDRNIKANSMRVQHDSDADSLLKLQSDSPAYAGAGISLEFAAEKSKNFHIFEAKASGDRILSVDGSGSVEVAGDSLIKGGLAVGGLSHMKGPFVWEKKSVTAGDHILIPTSKTTYADIISDGVASANEVKFENGEYNGQVVVVTNLDDEETKGEASISPGSTLLFVYNHGRWRVLEAVSAHFEEITKLKRLEVANDVFIGNHTLTAGGFKMLDLQRGDLLLGGADGKIRTRKGLTFLNGVLSTPSLNVEQLGGALDANFNIISNAVMEKSQLNDVSISASSVRLRDLSGIAYFDEIGNLKGTKEFVFDDGKLMISDLWNDLNLHQKGLLNISSIDVAELRGCKRAEIDSLFVSAMKSDEYGRIAFVGSDGALQSSADVSISTDGLFLPRRVGAYSQNGSVSFNNNELLEPFIFGGNAEKLSRVSAEEFRLLEEPVSAEYTLAVVSPGGSIRRDDGSPSNVNKLSAKSLHVTSEMHLPSAPHYNDKVNVAGIVESNGEVVRSSVSISNGSIQSKKVETEELTASTVLLSGKEGGVLTLGRSGEVETSMELKIKEVSVDTLVASGAAHLESIFISPLSSKPGKLSVLAIDSSGKVSTSDSLELHADALTASTSVTTPMLRLSGASKSSVLAVGDETGAVEATSALEVESVKAASVHAVDTLTAGAVRLTGAVESSTIGVDRDGFLVTSDVLSAKEANLGAVSASSISSEKLLLSRLPPGSLLQVSADSSVEPAVSIAIDGVRASSLTVTGSSAVKSLVLSHSPGASLLATDSDGLVVPATAGSLRSLSIEDKLSASTIEAEVLSTPKLSPGVAVVRENGVVDSTDLLHTSHLQTSSLDVMVNASVASLHFKDKRSGLLHLNSVGEVEAVNTISLDRVDSKIVSSSELTADSLKLPTHSNSLLAVDANGNVISATMDSHFAHISPKSISSSKATFSELNFVPFSSSPSPTEKTRFLTIDDRGSVSANAVVEAVHVSSETCTVDTADIGTLVMPGLTAGMLLMTGKDGRVGTTGDISATSIQSSLLDASSATVDTLKVKSFASASPGVVGAGKDGLLNVLSDVSLDALSTGDIHVSRTSRLQDAHIKKLFLGNSEETSALSVVLGVNADTGEVSSSRQLKVESLEAKDAAFSGVISAPGMKLSSLSGGVLSASEDGTLGIDQNPKMSDLTTDSILTSRLSLSGAAPGILSVGEKGDVSSTSVLSVSELDVSSFANFQGDVVASSLRSRSLSRDVSSEAVVVADSDGNLKSTEDISLKSVRSEVANIDSAVITGSLSIASLPPSSILMTLPDGSVSAASAVSMQSASAKEVRSDDVFVSNALSLSSIPSAAILSTDKAGRIVATADLKASSAEVASLSAAAVTSKEYRLEGGGTGVISATKDGVFAASNDLIVDSLSASSSVSSASGKFESLQLASVKSAPFLTTNSDGTLVSKNDLEVHSVSSSVLTVSGLGTLDKLKVSSLASDTTAVLMSDGAGNVLKSSDVKLSSLNADSVTTDAMTTSSLSVPGAAVGGVLTVTSSKGGIESSSSLKVDDIKVEKLVVSDSAILSDLQVKSLSSKSKTPEIIVVDNTGKLTTVPNLDEYLPNMKDSKFSSVDVSGGISASSIHIKSSGLVDGMVLAVDKSGAFTPSSSPELSSLSVSRDLSVRGQLQTSKLSIENTASSLIFSNRNNEISALEGSKILQDGTLSLKGARIDSLLGDVSLNGHSLSDVQIKKAKILESEVLLDSKAARHGGNLALRNMDSGLLEHSDSVSVTPSGDLQCNGLSPLSRSGKLSIQKASIVDSTMSNVEIDAVSISSSSLSVKSGADFSGDVFVEGSLTARGSVMGSGPYVDSSDARFKKSISPITGALDSVCAIGGSYFEYRVDEFPSRGFERGRQMGWVADRLEEVAPELVRVDEEGYRHVAYSRASALLAAAIKEMRAEFEEDMASLRKELQDTREELATLKKKNMAL